MVFLRERGVNEKVRRWGSGGLKMKNRVGGGGERGGFAMLGAFCKFYWHYYIADNGSIWYRIIRSLDSTLYYLLIRLSLFPIYLTPPTLTKTNQKTNKMIPICNSVDRKGMVIDFDCFKGKISQHSILIYLFVIFLSIRYEFSSTWLLTYSILHFISIINVRMGDSVLGRIWS